MKLLKTLTFMGLASLLVTCFQNCGSKVGDTGQSKLDDSPEQIIPVDKTIAQITIPKSTFDENHRLELRSDGDVMDVESGTKILIDATLKQQIADTLRHPSLCYFEPAPLPVNSVSCMAIALPHAFARTDQGEEIPLRLSVCHSEATDLCQVSRQDFFSLVQKIQKSLTP